MKTSRALWLRHLPAASQDAAADDAFRFNRAKGAVLRARDSSREKKAAAVDRIFRQTLAAHKATEA